MKKILITGSDSFVGTSFERYVNRCCPDLFKTDVLDMRDPNWEKYDFSGYDCVFHVAGIAHSDNGKISSDKKSLYYSVNTDLTLKTARKSKAEGVKQFIFMSSAIVYGESSKIGKAKIITEKTPINPANCYGDSKLQAEIGLRQMSCESFNVVILRPPMIYGKGCKGNYKALVKLANSLPVFPYVSNLRSMIYIDNLCEFICLMITNDESGTFYPQNSTYSNTSEMVQLIAEVHGRKLFLVKGFTWFLKLLSYVVGIVDKAFGSLAYDMKISEYKSDYRVVSDFKETIKLTEDKN